MTERAVMEIEDVLEYLPHRYPALLVDRITSITLGERIAGIKNVTINEPYFQGHFPGHPIMPGVMIVESMAQLAGILGFKTKGKKPADGMVYYLAGVDDLRFKRPVRPGDRLEMEAVMLNTKRHFGRFSCQAYVDGQLTCRATLLCAEQQVTL